MLRKADAPSQSDALSEQLREITSGLQALNERFDGLSRQVAVATVQPRGIELLRKLGVTPDRFLQRYFENLPGNALYEALFGGSKSLRGRPGVIGLTSTPCQHIHFSTDEFRFWLNALGILPSMHRKYWEWFYIAQALFEHDMLRDGKNGLVFAVGQERLPALFATYGCKILATDQAPDKAIASGWGGNMYSAEIDTLFDPRISSREDFNTGVSFAHVDMNDIQPELENRFDFCWSSCAFEHLGSLEHGLRFVERSIDTLVPGGIAVHTTEYNLSSNDDTMETAGCSIFRRRDIEELVTRLERAGHRVLPLDWTSGSGFAETVIDLPPYLQSPHLRLQIDQYVCTSIGLIVQKNSV